MYSLSSALQLSTTRCSVLLAKSVGHRRVVCGRAQVMSGKTRFFARLALLQLALQVVGPPEVIWWSVSLMLVEPRCAMHIRGTHAFRHGSASDERVEAL